MRVSCKVEARGGANADPVAGRPLQAPCRWKTPGGIAAAAAAGAGRDDEARLVRAHHELLVIISETELLHEQRSFDNLGLSKSIAVNRRLIYT